MRTSISSLGRQRTLSLNGPCSSPPISNHSCGDLPVNHGFKRSQLRWVATGLPGEAPQACPTVRRPQTKPLTRWRDDISWLVWKQHRFTPGRVEEVSKDRGVRALLLSLPWITIYNRSMDGHASGTFQHHLVLLYWI